jgi:anti-sigma regulatory factor (Ser/Thr protein kinase)
MSDTLRLEHGVHAPGHARRWIIQRCSEWQCDDLADAAALLVTELVTNVFLHARTDCLIQAAFDDSILEVTVTDGDAHELLIHPTSTSAENGRGLVILEALADAWGVQQQDGSAKTKSVWFQLTEHPPAAHTST